MNYIIGKKYVYMTERDTKGKDACMHYLLRLAKVAVPAPAPITALLGDKLAEHKAFHCSLY